MLKERLGIKKVRILVLVLAAAVLLTGAGSALAVGNASGSGICRGLGIGRNVGSLANQVCDILGMSRQELATERQAGKSLVDIAAEHNVSKETLTATVLEKRQENLKQALQENKVTQQQYDQCTQRMQQNIEKKLSNTNSGQNQAGKGKGRDLGRGRGHGMCRQACPNNNQQ